MGVIVEEKTIFTLFFKAGHSFANNVQLEDFSHMQALIGGECIALTLPCDILMWHGIQDEENGAAHTLTVERNGQLQQIFGNCIFTSNDNEGLLGIRSLSEFQMKWLGEHHDLIESQISGDFVIKFITK